MAKYHVGCNLETGVIAAGTTNKKGDKWINCSEVTEEALLAVRNHFLRLAEKEQTTEYGYRWDYDDGSAITLKVVYEKNPPELKEKDVVSGEQ